MWPQWKKKFSPENWAYFVCFTDPKLFSIKIRVWTWQNGQLLPTFTENLKAFGQVVLELQRFTICHFDLKTVYFEHYFDCDLNDRLFYANNVLITSWLDQYHLFDVWILRVLSMKARLVKKRVTKLMEIKKCRSIYFLSFDRFNRRNSWLRRRHISRALHCSRLREHRVWNWGDWGKINQISVFLSSHRRQFCQGFSRYSLETRLVYAVDDN